MAWEKVTAWNGDAGGELTYWYDPMTGEMSTTEPAGYAPQTAFNQSQYGTPYANTILSSSTGLGYGGENPGAAHEGTTIYTDPASGSQITGFDPHTEFLADVRNLISSTPGTWWDKWQAVGQVYGVAGQNAVISNNLGISDAPGYTQDAHEYLGQVSGQLSQQNTGFGGMFEDVAKYQGFLGEDVLEKYIEDPERLALGINTPLESAAWGEALNKNYAPTVDMVGGDTEQQAAAATAQGMETGPGEMAHNVARLTGSIIGAGGTGPSGMEGTLSSGFGAGGQLIGPMGGATNLVAAPATSIAPAATTTAQAPIQLAQSAAGGATAPAPAPTQPFTGGLQIPTSGSTPGLQVPTTLGNPGLVAPTGSSLGSPSSFINSPSLINPGVVTAGGFQAAGTVPMLGNNPAAIVNQGANVASAAPSAAGGATTAPTTTPTSMPPAVPETPQSLANMGLTSTAPGVFESAAPAVLGGAAAGAANGLAGLTPQTLGSLIAAGLGAYGANQQANALENIASQENAWREQMFNLGAPYREKLSGALDPSFNINSIPGLQQSMDTSYQGLLRGLSTSGNPYGNPGGLMEAQKYVTGNLALPAYQNYRDFLAGAGGLTQYAGGAANSSGGSAASAAAANAQGGVYNALGYGLYNATNPYQRLSLNIGGLV